MSHVLRVYEQDVSLTHVAQSAKRHEKLTLQLTFS